MLIFMLIMIGVVTFQRDTFRDNLINSGTFTNVQNAEEILGSMVTPLRSASEGSDGSYPILTAGSSTLTFFSDLHGNGIKERVRYFLSSTTLEEGIMVPTGTPLSYNNATETISYIAYNVRNASLGADVFDYYNNTYNGTSSPITQPVSVSAVSLVKITLILNSASNVSSGPITYTTQVTLRNLKDNL
jgi:hypothetical protein